MLSADTTSTLAQDAPAIVVEEVAANSVAARAGFAIGDRVLTYDARPVPSPAALQAGEENVFKTEIAVQVQRGNETLALAVPRGRLGLEVRPTMSREALTLYEDGRTAQQAKQVDDAVARWMAAAQAARAAGEMTSAAWLYGRIGSVHESARKWKEANAVYLAAWDMLQHGTDVAAQSERSTRSGGPVRMRTILQPRSSGTRRVLHWTKPLATRCGWPER